MANDTRPLASNPSADEVVNMSRGAMRHDTLALMAPATEHETARAMRSVRHVTNGHREHHTPESFALSAVANSGRAPAGTDDNWAAALVRLERSENARPKGSSPLTTIDRVRHLTVDAELQAHAGKIVRSRSDGTEIAQRSVMPLDKEMGQTWAGDMRSRLDQLATPSLVEYASGKGVSNAHDAVLVGSTLANIVDNPRAGYTGGIDAMTAEQFGIQRTRSLRDRLAGRSEQDVSRAAPAEERTRMMEIEDKAGVARDRGPAGTVEPRRLPPMEYHLAIHGTERHTGDFLQGGERLEQRIAAEKATLRTLDDQKLARTFSGIMPMGSIPGNATDRDRWIDSALRNEQMMVASGVAPSHVTASAVMRERGPIPAGPERVMPTGGIHSSAFHDSQDVAKNLELVSDTMLRRRFGQVHGMDHMRIPEAPDQRRSWIHQASMLKIAADHQPNMAAGRKTAEPALATAPERQIDVERLRPAARAAMMGAGQGR